MEEKTEANVYKLVLTGKGVTVEKDISESVARRVMTLALGGGVGANESAHIESASDSAPIEGGATAKVFMAAKRPMSDVERITCLAYYLTHYKNTQHFKTLELTKLNVDAAQPKFSNPTVAARNAVQKEYLSLVGGAKKQITSRGETLVEALPDRERVKAALAVAPARRRRSSRVTKKEV